MHGSMRFFCPERAGLAWTGRLVTIWVFGVGKQVKIRRNGGWRRKFRNLQVYFTRNLLIFVVTVSTSTQTSYCVMCTHKTPELDYTYFVF